MLSFFKNIDLLKAKKVAGVEVFLSPSSLLFNVVIVEKVNQKIQIISTFESLDIEGLKEKVDKNIPLFLTLDGKGVLHKNASYSEEETPQNLLSKVLPGADPEAFYIQAVAGEFISVVRKDAVDAALNELVVLGYYFVGVSLGPFAIERALSLFEEKTVNTSLYTLKLSDQKIESFSKKESASNLKMNVGGEQVSENLVLPFVSALNYFIDDSPFFESEIINQSKGEFKEKRKFSVIGMSLLAFFFVLMFSNYLVYDSLKNSNNELQAQFDMQSENFKKSEELKKELDAKKSLKEKLGVNGATRISFYLDKIAATVPAQIQLTELALNPVEKKIKDDKEIEYEVNQIIIAGKCKKSIYYNEWKKELGKMEWVKNISVVNYIDADDEVGEFILKITF